jgi:hypothetical protein
VNVPGERALSYVRIDTADAHNVLRRLDLATRATSSLGPTLVGRTAHAWIAGHQTILMAKGSTDQGTSPGTAAPGGKAAKSSKSSNQCSRCGPSRVRAEASRL